MKLHPFERAGLGKAPFRFVGQERSVYQACPGAPIQPGASCDYCANGISEVYWIQSSDLRRFKVGCDCVLKVSREAATTDAEKLIAAVEEAHRRANRAKARARADLKAAELRALLADPAVRAKLAAQPHPQVWRAERGETLLDSVEWMAAHSGAAGTAKTLKLVKEACA